MNREQAKEWASELAPFETYTEAQEVATLEVHLGNVHLGLDAIQLRRSLYTTEQTQALERAIEAVNALKEYTTIWGKAVQARMEEFELMIEENV